MAKMKYFLFTNAPNVYSDCRAIWMSRAEARESLSQMPFQSYVRLFRGHWNFGIIPRMQDLTEVRISTLLQKTEKRRTKKTL